LLSGREDRHVDEVPGIPDQLIEQAVDFHTYD
jgi:hypothetical protein